MPNPLPRLFGVGAVESDGAWRLDAHQHEHHELLVVSDGAHHAVVEGHQVEALSGDLLFYGGGKVHRERADAKKGVKMQFLAFTWPCEVLFIPLITKDRDGRIGLLVNWLHTEWRSPKPQAKPLVAHLFQALFAEFERLLYLEEDPLVEKVRTHILSHIAEPIELEHLAKLVELSKFHFVRSYKQLTGRTPMADVRALRISQAQQLLLTSDKAVKAIARATGFANEHHMCRLFREHLNSTPGEIRASVK